MARRCVRRLWIGVATLALAAAWIGLGDVATASAATFTVNSTADADHGACTVVVCSLRDAINAANANPGTDTIAFNIPFAPPYLIQPLSMLPIVTDPVVIDGTTQPGYVGMPLVQLDGSLAPGPPSALWITAGSSTVKGLSITRFGIGLALGPGGG